MNNKTIFKWFSMLLLMMVASISGASAQSLTVEDFSIKAGETKDVAIKLGTAIQTGDYTIYGIQTDIVLSEGLSLEGLTAMDDSLNFTSNTVSSGAKRISLLSMRGNTIPAGDVVTLKVKASENFQRGIITLTNTRLTVDTKGDELKVEDATANVTLEEVVNTDTATFDFTALDHATSTSTTNDGDITADEMLTEDGVTMTITPNPSGTPNRYWSVSNKPQLRMYGGTMTLVAPEGQAIVKVVIDNGKWNTANTFNGVAAASGEWVGNSTNVILAVAGNTQMNKVEVTLADANAETTTYGAASIANTAETAYTVAQAIELIEAGQGLSDVVFVKGIVSQVDKFLDGAINYWISDDGTTTSAQFECYKGKGIKGADFTSIDDVKEGAVVVVTGTMKKYTPSSGEIIYEFNAGNELVSYEYEAPVLNTYTATFTTNAEWEKVYAYAWSGEGDNAKLFLGAWPGTELTDSAGIYTVIIEAVEAPEKIIFNNGQEGEGNQTEDLAFENGKAYEYNAPVGPELNTYTATFTTNAGWEIVYAYAWTEENGTTVEQLGEWPGKKLVADSLGVYTVTIKAEAAPAMIAFNNGQSGEGNQTEDLAFENGKAYEYMVELPITFNFNALEHATSTSNSTDGDITADEVLREGGVTMTISPKEEGTKTENRFWSTTAGPQLRMYSGTLTLEAPEGKAIVKVVINGTWKDGNSFNGVVAQNGVWEGNSTNVVLAVAGNTQMNKVEVTLADANEETTTYEIAVEKYFTATFTTNAEWEKVYAYAWSGEGDNAVKFLGDWPGTELKADSLGVYTVTIKAVEAPEKIIFNNGQEGEGNQTGDLAFENGKAYEYNAPVGPELNTYTATFTTNAGWEVVYAYTWTEENGTKVEQLGAWPGKKLVADSLGIYTVIIKAEAAPAMIVFSNGQSGEGNQTADIEFVDGLVYEYIIELPTVATFDFNASNHATSTNSTHDGDITENEVITEGGVTMTITPNPSGTPNRYWTYNNSPQLRMYGGTMTLVAPEGQAIVKVVINNGKWNDGNTFNGVAAATGEWTGNSTNVILAIAANTQMNKVEVTLADANEETTTYEILEIKTMVIVGDFITDLEANSEDTEPWWNPENGLEMTQDDENPAIWTLTIEGFDAEAKKYEYKAVGNGSYDVYQLPEQGNQDFIFGTDEYPEGKYDLTFTADTKNHTLTLDVKEAIATGISSIAAEAQKGNVYNLNGQKVMKTQKGLYIINGKKAVMK